MNKLKTYVSVYFCYLAALIAIDYNLCEPEQNIVSEGDLKKILVYTKPVHWTIDLAVLIVVYNVLYSEGRRFYTNVTSFAVEIMLVF